MFQVINDPEVLDDITQGVKVVIQKEVTDENNGFNMIVSMDQCTVDYGLLLAQELSLPFVPIKKSGMLPELCHKQEFIDPISHQKQYLEVQQNRITQDSNILLVIDHIDVDNCENIRAAEKLILNNHPGAQISSIFSFFVTENKNKRIQSKL